jgi:hypothetical protein
VTAAGPGSEWAFGTTGNQDDAFALECTGSTWSRVPFSNDSGIWRYNGRSWSKLYGVGVMHYSDGRLTTAKLPIPAIGITGLSRIPGTTDILAGGVVVHKNATTVAAILKYTP